MRIRTKKTYYYLESLIRERFNLFGTDIYIKFNRTQETVRAVRATVLCVLLQLNI